VATATFWLSFHTPYACRHSGVCCSSDWDIDIEPSRIPPIEQAVARGQLSAPVHWHRTVTGAPDDVGGVLARSRDGRCVFHGDPGCAIHTVLGHDAMPSACQHFPRIVLLDPRGVSVTLSHYCPTAASLLFEARGPASIVKGPPALPGGAPPEGLDARDALPPLETPQRLMDWDSFSAWERRAVDLLTSGLPVEAALDQLDRRDAAFGDRMLFEMAREAVVAPYEWPPFVGSADLALVDAAVVGRYFAAHAFAAWTAYQGDGLRCTVLYLRLVLAVLKNELARRGSLLDAIRQSDLLLRHLVDRGTVADRLSGL
jgi:Fe-S-cluster containining protein